MLTFVGLGLWDERSVTIAGQEAINDADRVFAEFYTSDLFGTSVAELESYHGTAIEVRDRHGVERDPEPILEAAASGKVAFLTAGDPMISTTHVDLRLRAQDRGVDTDVVHAPTAQSAASSLTGLQNYRFGKATTLPFPRAHGGDDVPESVIETIEGNLERGLHTLVYLDIKATDGEYMAGSTAASVLAGHWREETLGVVVARAGSPNPIVEADTLAELGQSEFGGPLHLLVIPGDVHHIEAEALEKLAGAPADRLGQ